MATVNQRLRENPGLQRMPKTEREWVQYQNELAKWVLKVASFGDGTITTSAGTQVDGLDEIPGAVHLGDGSIKTSGEVQIDGLDEMPGTLAGGESIPTVNTFNKGSVQSTATLTASDGGGTATISIAAHNVVYDNGTVAYNSGSITGLAFSTKYYVYTDDPTKAGGAVTYAASVTSTDSVANSGRYYLGSITTGVVGTSGNIAGVTKAGSTVFTTTPAHGFTTGATVTIASIVDDGGGGSDMEALFNGNSYILTVLAPTTFTVPVDSTSLVAVWVSGGTATQTASAPSGGYGGGGGIGDTELP